MEVYIDDMLIKLLRATDHIIHLKQAFSDLASYQIKLNPKKYMFGVSLGQFLRYLVMQRRIKVHLSQIRAILNMSHLSSINEVQRLTGQIAALSKFIIHSIDECAEGFKVLKNQKSFEWMKESKRVFEDLKSYLTTPLILSKLIDGESCTYI